VQLFIFVMILCDDCFRFFSDFPSQAIFFLTQIDVLLLIHGKIHVVIRGFQILFANHDFMRSVLIVRFLFNYLQALQVLLPLNTGHLRIHIFYTIWKHIRLL
jgi:hypothetical protein